jgi:isoleucyl-tRNA synthetase
MYDLACQRANSREVVVINGPYDKILWKAEPIMKKIGPSFGKIGPQVKVLIESADGTAMRKEIADNGEFLLAGPEGEIRITTEHVMFTEVMPENIFSAEMIDATVFVDTTLTADLEAEGYTRELIRRIQEMRKQMNLNVEEMITIDAIIQDSHLFGLLNDSWKDLICKEVRAVELVIHQTNTTRDAGKLWQMDRDWDVEGISVTIGISIAK